MTALTHYPRYQVTMHPEDPHFWQITAPTGRSVGLATSQAGAIDYAATLARMSIPHPPLGDTK